MLVQPRTAPIQDGSASTADWLDQFQQSGTGRYIREEINDATSAEAPTFSEPLPETIEVDEGEPLRLQVGVQPAADANMRIEWTFNGQPLRFGSRLATFYDFGLVTLSVLDVRIEDSGEYVCRAQNSLGINETRCQLKCKRK